MIHLILLLHILICILNEVLSAPLPSTQFRFFLDTIEIEAFLTNSSEKITFCPNIATDTSWISNHALKLEYNRPIKSLGYENIAIKNTTEKSERLLFPFKIENAFEINEFSINYIDKSSLLLSDSLALGYKFKDISRSIIHILKNQGIISQAAFGFKQVSLENKGVLYFGGMSKAIEDNLEKAVCHVNPQYTHWGCDMKYMFFNHDISNGIYIDSYSYFVSNTFYSLLPTKYFELIVEKLFGQLIVMNKCQYQTRDKLKCVVCECNSVKNIEDITFVIEGTGFDMGYKKMFEKVFSSCYFNFRTIDKDSRNTEKQLGNVWLLGTSFYIDYYTKFSYEDSTISFYMDDDFQKVDISPYIKIDNKNDNKDYSNENKNAHTVNKVNKKIVISSILVLTMVGLLFNIYIKEKLV